MHVLVKVLEMPVSSQGVLNLALKSGVGKKIIPAEIVLGFCTANVLFLVEPAKTICNFKKSNVRSLLYLLCDLVTELLQ